MRRTLALLLALGALVPAGAAAAAPPPLSATLHECATGPGAGDRFAVFAGSMPALRGGHRMAMRFDLLERRPGSRRWVRVDAPKLGRWERSSPRRAGFVYTKRVEELRAPALYRAVVRFRWLALDGTVVRRALRRTGACRQPDPRPDLRVDRIGMVGDGRYAVTVRNVGAGDATAFAVGLAVAGRAQQPLEVAGLAAGQRTTVELAGEPCRPGDTVRAVADARRRIAERSERNNALAVACP